MSESHGLTGYERGCRCGRCRNARSDYRANKRQGLDRLDRDALADVLNEICPDGLTADSPRGRYRFAL